jgi:transcriptional regulator with XRE-family HTH domain
MINNSEFAERLRQIMEFYQLSASAFAERIQVQRSSISHLLSGRNKPSLDFVMRVVREFDQVELYWLLNGKGSFPDDGTSNIERKTQSVSSEPEYSKQRDSLPPASTSSDIERIVVFYKDGSFKAYTP